MEPKNIGGPFNRDTRMESMKETFINNSFDEYRNGDISREELQRRIDEDRESLH